MNTTSQETGALQTRQQFDLSPQTFDQAMTFSQYLADSDLVPKDFKGKPGNCLIAMQWGSELGLKPLQALQNLAIINGRPALWGDAVIALARGSAVCEYIIESQTDDVATCRVKRRGEPEQERSFSKADAKAAGLLGKQGPWTQYPKRMMQMRARAFALRDVFPDVLRGMPVAEEIMDIPSGNQVAHPPAQPEPQAFYPADQFEKNLPTWINVMAAGRKTAAQIIAMAQTKFPLTDDQIERIKSGAKANVEDIAPKGPSIASIEAGLRDATNMDQLYEAASLIQSITDQDSHQALLDLYEARHNEMNQE
jgi:hypothetical protein